MSKAEYKMFTTTVASFFQRLAMAPRKYTQPGIAAIPTSISATARFTSRIEVCLRRRLSTRTAIVTALDAMATRASRLKMVHHVMASPGSIREAAVAFSDPSILQ